VEEDGDARAWTPTDRKGESLTLGTPLPGLEVLSARGSERLWCETVHEMFTVAAVHPGEPWTATEWRTRGRSLTTAGGQLMAINADDGHRTTRVYAPAAFDAVKLAPSWLEDAGHAMGMRVPFHFRWPSQDSAVVFQAVRRLVRAIARRQSEFVVESACHELVHALWTEAAHAAPRPAPRALPEADPRLRRVAESLAEQPTVRPSLDALVRDTGIGKSQLCVLFKRQYGVSMGRYWTEHRILRARRLLLEGVPAKYVAADLGFTDEPHFSRKFKRHHGLPPAAWVSLYVKNSRGLAVNLGTKSRQLGRPGPA
jgi:AraC-like DNA-binding protein